MPRTLGVNYIMNKEYRSLPFDGEWLETFGAPSDPFSMLVYGHPKNKFVVIDSRDFINLTCVQFKKLKLMFPRKSFIIICWESANKPAGKFAKDIEFIVDIVVHVRNFKAYPRSRFGGSKEYTIWDKAPVVGSQLKLHVA